MPEPVDVVRLRERSWQDADASVFQEVRTMVEQVARLEAKLDALVAGLKARGSL